MSRPHIMFAIASPSGVDPAAMDKAVCLASALHTDLELFHCAFDSDITHPGRFATRGVQEDIHGLAEQRRQQLERHAARARTFGVRVRSSVRWDYPTYEGIVRQVLRHQPDLLIAQSTPKGRAARLLLSQTDYKLMESCPCPLLLIKSRRPYLDPSVLAAVDPGHVHDKPAALDQAILDSAGMISGALSGKLLVFHARTPWNDAVRATPELRDLPEAVSDEVRAAYCDRIEDQVMELAQDHEVPRRRVHIVEGYAARVLPGVAHRELADIVAMGAVSRSPLKRALIGHTAERVLDALDCDVLIVKPPGFSSPVRQQSAHHVERTRYARIMTSD